jgi:hypothetical protein
MADEHRPAVERWSRRGALVLAASGIVAATALARSGGDPVEATPAEAAESRGRPFRPRNVFVFGHSWAAGVNVRPAQSWPARVAARLSLPRPAYRTTDDRRSDFAWGGARATGTTAEHGAAFVLQSLPAGPRVAPSLLLLLTGDLDIGRHGRSAASRALMGGGIHAALGRLLATEVHEEDDAAAWAFGGGWETDRGTAVNSGAGAAYSLRSGATFAIRLPAGYDGSPLTVGLPLWDRTVGGSIAWELDGTPLDRRTDLEALRGVLTGAYPRATYAERFGDLRPGARELRGTWTAGARGTAVVVDYWSLERRGTQILCALMPGNNPWGNTFGAITTTSNAANREALAGYDDVTYVDLQDAVCPTGTSRDRRFWDSDASSHLTRAGEIAVAQLVTAAVRRIRV